uniref:BRCT domain-containing protein n=1 Tax=Macrostomum lignano TaxID=282301 RepID=A0A1I8FFB1_9PLAT
MHGNIRCLQRYLVYEIAGCQEAAPTNEKTRKKKSPSHTPHDQRSATSRASAPLSAKAATRSARTACCACACLLAAAVEQQRRQKRRGVKSRQVPARLGASARHLHGVVAVSKAGQPAAAAALPPLQRRPSAHAKIGRSRLSYRKRLRNRPRIGDTSPPRLRGSAEWQQQELEQVSPLVLATPQRRELDGRTAKADTTADLTLAARPRRSNRGCPAEAAVRGPHSGCCVYQAPVPALVSGAWLLSFDWVSESLAAGSLLPESDFEIQGDLSARRQFAASPESLPRRQATGCLSVAVADQDDAKFSEARCQAIAASGDIVVLNRDWLLDSISKFRVQQLDSPEYCIAPDCYDVTEILTRQRIRLSLFDDF